MADVDLVKLRELVEKATPGPWELWTSCSWRRFGSRGGSHVCEPILQHSDNHPDLFFKNGGEMGPDAQLIALAPDLARNLLALSEECREAEVQRATMELRATAAEQALQAMRERMREIREIAGAPVLTAGGDPRDRSLPSRLRERLDRIAAIASKEEENSNA